MNGYTLQFYLLNDPLRNELRIWLAGQHVLAVILSWASIVFEASFFLAVLVPTLCWIYIPIGIAFHVGNAVLGVAWFFQYIALYITFLPKFVETFRRYKFGSVPSVKKNQPGIPDAEADRAVVLFDGDCNLCNGWVRFVIKRDRGALIAFAPFESGIGRSMLEKHGLQNLARDSVVFIAQDDVYVRSDAVLQVATRLDGWWATTGLLRVLPKWWRDRCYDLVARHRYRLFGRRESCALPTKDELSRFVDRQRN